MRRTVRAAHLENSEPKRIFKLLCVVFKREWDYDMNRMNHRHLKAHAVEGRLVPVTLIDVCTLA